MEGTIFKGNLQKYITCKQLKLFSQQIPVIIIIKKNKKIQDINDIYGNHLQNNCKPEVIAIQRIIKNQISAVKPEKKIKLKINLVMSNKINNFHCSVHDYFLA